MAQTGIGKSNVERVKERLDIVTVVGAYVQLQKAGVLLKARCPFHNEKSPSFTVSSVRQTYHCFGCGEHGDIFTFVEKIEGLDFRGALDLLAHKAGVELIFDKNGKDTGPTRDEKDELYAINEHAAVHFEANLKQHRTVLAYLRERGLSEKTISTFRIGFAVDAWQDTRDALHAQAHTEANIEAVGLILKSTKETGDESRSRYYDRFRSRIMFPICNTQGKVAGFTGRAWIDHTHPRTQEQQEKDAAAAKYVNSPETPLYHKSSILYGLHIAKHSIRPLNCVLVVEGQMDLLTCHQVGYTNAVAISGTALTTEQVQQLSRLSKNMILALDSDAAGESATLKSLEKALAFGCDVKVVSFLGKDASEVLQKEGAEAVRTCVREAVDWLSYVLRLCESRAGGDMRARARHIHEFVLPLVKAIESPLERDALLFTIHERTQLSLASLQESLATARGTSRADGTERVEASSRTTMSGTHITKESTHYTKLLHACLEVPEVRAHTDYTAWAARAAALEHHEIGDEEMHALLAQLPDLTDGAYMREYVADLLWRAEKTHNEHALARTHEALRSAELKGDHEEIVLLREQSAQLIRAKQSITLQR